MSTKGPWWMPFLMNPVPKVKDKEFLSTYDKLHVAGFEPTSASIVANILVHNPVKAHALDYLRIHSNLTLDNLHYRDSLRVTADDKDNC